MEPTVTISLKEYNDLLKHKDKISANGYFFLSGDRLGSFMVNEENEFITCVKKHDEIAEKEEA